MNDDRWHDPILILDDATREIYHARLVPGRVDANCHAALREVIETKGLFCSLYCGPGLPLFRDHEGGR